MYYSVMHSNNYHVSNLQQKHYKLSFLIIVICHYLSLVSQLAVNYVRCSSVTVCCYAMRHSHSRDIIPILISISIFQLTN